MGRLKKKKNIFFCIFKMNFISAERYKNSKVDFLQIRKTDEIWVSMKHLHDRLGIKNMSDLVLKEIHGKYERKNLTDEEIRKYKMSEREIFKKYDNLSENERNNRNNKEIYVRNDVIMSVIVRWRGEKEEGKKLMDSEEN